MKLLLRRLSLRFDIVARYLRFIISYNLLEQVSNFKKHFSSDGYVMLFLLKTQQFAVTNFIFEMSIKIALNDPYEIPVSLSASLVLILLLLSAISVFSNFIGDDLLSHPDLALYSTFSRHFGKHLYHS